MEWPIRPKCHDRDFHAKRFGEIQWRPPYLDVPNGRVETFHTCSYCRSMSPEDLYKHLTTWKPQTRVIDFLGGQQKRIDQIKPLQGADWKYGWPHKFYVDGIPNPIAGQPCQMGTRSYPIHTCCGAEFSGGSLDACPKCQKDRFSCNIVRNHSEPIMGTANRFTHAKFYNIHLLDPELETFTALAEEIAKFASIKFILDGQELKYQAPHRGFQA